MSAPGGYNMQTLMRRLEAATSRLEDLAGFIGGNEVPAGTGAGAGAGPTDPGAGSAAAFAESAAVSPKTRALSGSGSVAQLHDAAVGAAAGAAAGATAGATVGATVGATAGPTAGANAGAAVGTAAGTNAPFGAGVPQPARSKAFDDLTAALDTLGALSGRLDPLVAEQMRNFTDAAAAAIDVVSLSASTQRPDPAGPDYVQLLAPISSKVTAVLEAREANRNSRFANHLATLAEGAPVFGWVSQDRPASYVQDFKDSAQFYANRVLKEFREEPVHTEWVKTLLGYFMALKAAVTVEYPQGLVWNAQGAPLAESLAQFQAHAGSGASGASARTAPATPAAPAAPSGSNTASAAAAARGASSVGPSPKSSVAGGAPPPPPPPPPSIEQLTSGLAQNAAAPSAAGAGAATSSSGTMSAVFQELKQGTEITSGLKHVDRKALKAEKAAGSAPGAPPRPPKPANLRKASATAAAGAGAPAAAPTKPPKTELVDNRWIVENYVENHEIKLEVDMTQSVHIDNCQHCTVRIEGKATAVTINRCKRTGVLVDTLVSGVDIIKSQDFGLQITGRVHSITIDQSHGGQIYLSEEALDADIYSSQISAVNVNLPTSEPGDYKEVPLPEQILSKIHNGSSVVSTAVSASDK